MGAGCTSLTADASNPKYSLYPKCFLENPKLELPAITLITDGFANVCEGKCEGYRQYLRELGPADAAKKAVVFFFEQFLDALRELNAETAKRFEGKTSVLVRADSFQRMVRMAVRNAVPFNIIDEREAAERSIKALAHGHAIELGVLPQEYALVIDAILAALEQCIGDEFEKQRDAWRTLYSWLLLVILPVASAAALPDDSDGSKVKQQASSS